MQSSPDDFPRVRTVLSTCFAVVLLAPPHILYFTVTLYLWPGIQVLHRRGLHIVFLSTKLIYIKNNVVLKILIK